MIWQRELPLLGAVWPASEFPGAQKLTQNKWRASSNANTSHTHGLLAVRENWHLMWVCSRVFLALVLLLTSREGEGFCFLVQEWKQLWLFPASWHLRGSGCCSCRSLELKSKHFILGAEKKNGLTVICTLCAPTDTAGSCWRNASPRLFGVGRDLWGQLLQPLLKWGHLQQGAQETQHFPELLLAAFFPSLLSFPH